VAGELDHGGAHPAVGAVHQDRLPGAHPGGAVQHLVGGQPGDDQGLHLPGVEVGRHGDDVARCQHGVTGPAAGLGHRRHLLAEQVVVDAGADGGDGADQVVAGHERELGLSGVAAQAHGVLGEGDAGGCHGDQHLACGGGGQLALADLEAVGSDAAGQDHLGGGRARGGALGGCGCAGGGALHGCS